MNIVFFGNTKHSLIGAKIIHQQLGLTAIVTIADSPLAFFGREQNIPVIIASKLTPPIISQIAEFAPDFLIVEDYGLILPKKVLDLPKYASLNIHHSLLPKYRGPAPAPAAILAGDKMSGVTVITMAETVDTGDILAQKEYELKPDETNESLLTVLNQIGGEIIVPVIKAYSNNSAKPKKQDDSQASYTKHFTREDGYFDSNNPPSPEQLDRMIRAYYPWPGVWSKLMINGKEKIVKFLPENKLQVEGKKPMSVKDFLNGYPELKEQLSLTIRA